jgi:hypothetical protein
VFDVYISFDAARKTEAQRELSRRTKKRAVTAFEVGSIGDNRRRRP